jgi:hypothetical protein
MIRIILILLILIGLSSCNNTTYYSPDFQRTCVVVAIKQYEDHRRGGTYCHYEVLTNDQLYVNGVRGAFYEACGKFTVGDTVAVVKY